MIASQYDFTVMMNCDNLLYVILYKYFLLSLQQQKMRMLQKRQQSLHPVKRNPQLLQPKYLNLHHLYSSLSPWVVLYHLPHQGNYSLAFSSVLIYVFAFLQNWL